MGATLLAHCKIEARGERLWACTLQGTQKNVFRPDVVSFYLSVSSLYLGNNRLHLLTMKITLIIEFLVGKIISLKWVGNSSSWPSYPWFLPREVWEVQISLTMAVFFIGGVMVLPPLCPPGSETEIKRPRGGNRIWFILAQRNREVGPGVLVFGVSGGKGRNHEEREVLCRIKLWCMTQRPWAPFGIQCPNSVRTQSNWKGGTWWGQ